MADGPAQRSPGGAPRRRQRRIRVLALGLPVLHDHLLLGPVLDRDGATLGYRALGGGVEFGERAADAVVREFREETGRAIEVVERIAASENLFEYLGAPGHEIVFTFHVRFAAGDEPADLAPLPFVEPGEGTREAVWIPLAEVLGGMHIVYPEGFADLLAAWLNRM